LQPANNYFDPPSNTVVVAETWKNLVCGVDMSGRGIPLLHALPNDGLGFNLIQKTKQNKKQRNHLHHYVSTAEGIVYSHTLSEKRHKSFHWGCTFSKSKLLSIS